MTNESEVGKCKLYNTRGLLLRSFQLTKGTNTYNVGSLKTGMYYIQIPSAKGIITHNIIKE
jgi:hypothetical protein